MADHLDRPVRCFSSVRAERRRPAKVSTLLRCGAAIGCVTLAAGCEPTWHKEGATQADFTRDDDNCRRAVAFVAPLHETLAPFLAVDYQDPREACLRLMGWEKS